LHLGEDRSAETRDGVPTLGGDVTDRTAARLGAVVVAGGDVGEGALVSVVHLVQQGVGETDLSLAVVQQEAVQERDDSSEDRGRGRSTVDLNETLAEHLDQVVVTVGSNVREATVGGIEVTSGQLHTRVQVGLDDITLPSRSGGDIRETSTSGDQSGGISADTFSGGGGASHLLADRRLVGLTLGLRRRRDQHGSTDRGDPRRGTREDGGDTARAVSELITGGTLVTRGSQESDTLETNLDEFSVDLVDVLVRRLTVGAVDDLALLVFGPAPGHGDDVGEGLGVEQLSGELVHPAVHSPEPEGRVESKGGGVLDVEGRLSVGAVARVRSHNLVDVDLLVHALVEGGQVLLVERSIVLEFSDANGALSVDPVLARHTVHGSQDARVDVAKRILLNRSLVDGLVVSVDGRGLNQLSQTEDHVDDLEVLGDVSSAEDTRVDLAGRSVLVVVELSLEQVLDDSDGSNDLDEVTARNVDLLNTKALQPSNNGSDFILARGNQVKDLLSSPPFAVVSRLGVGDVEQSSFEDVNIALLKSDTEVKHHIRVSATESNKVRGNSSSLNEHLGVDQGQSQDNSQNGDNYASHYL
jgi:hypothetical protein